MQRSLPSKLAPTSSPVISRQTCWVGAYVAATTLDAGERERLTWRQADAEDLPFGDAKFDTVMSCVVVMFAPHHQRSARELLRVCRPGA